MEAIILLFAIIITIIAICIYKVASKEQTTEKSETINYLEELRKLQMWIAEEKSLKKNNEQTLKELKEQAYLLEYENEKLKEKLEKVKPEAE